MEQEQIKQLAETARKVMERAYAPYSHFPVGAALLLADGQMITGVNIENVSFGATNCAERTALFTAWTKGYHKEDFVAIAVAGDTENFLPPCNICRQVMVELCPHDMPIYLTRKDHSIYETTLRELTPMAFETLDM